MKTFENIQEEAHNYFADKQEKINYFRDLAVKSLDKKELFNEFIARVKQNDYLAVFLILYTAKHKLKNQKDLLEGDYWFNSLEERAEFANRKDEHENSAYHYAALYDAAEVIVIFNKKFRNSASKKLQQQPNHEGQQHVYILYQEENAAHKTPLQLCCQDNKYQAFQAIWRRAGQTSNHNPTYALPDACLGGNPEIVKAIITSKNFDRNSTEVSDVLKNLEKSIYKTSVELILNELKIKINEDIFLHARHNKQLDSIKVGTHVSRYSLNNKRKIPLKQKKMTQFLRSNHMPSDDQHLTSDSKNIPS